MPYIQRSQESRLQNHNSRHAKTIKDQSDIENVPLLSQSKDVFMAGLGLKSPNNICGCFGRNDRGHGKENGKDGSKQHAAFGESHP